MESFQCDNVQKALQTSVPSRYLFPTGSAGNPILEIKHGWRRTVKSENVIVQGGNLNRVFNSLRFFQKVWL